MSVTTPWPVLSTLTLTPIRGSPPGSLTVPVIFAFWADAVIVTHTMNNIIRNLYITFFVLNCFIMFINFSCFEFWCTDMDVFMQLFREVHIKYIIFFHIFY